MGFKMADAVQEIRVALTYQCVNHDTGVDRTETVTHVFKLPSAADRNTYDQMQVRVKGKKIKSDKAAANWWLWRRCIVTVIGYDDLGENPTREAMEQFFASDIGRIHVDEFTDAMLERIAGEEADVAKKSELVSEQ